MGDSYCVEMLEGGAITACSILADSKSALVRVKVAKILHNMSKVEANLEQMLEEDAATTIVDLFRHHKPPELHHTLTAAVNEFARLEDARMELLPTVKPVLDVLKDATLEDQLVALAALARITTTGSASTRP